MMKGKTLSRVLAWMLTIAMVMPIAPAVVVAEENSQTSVCTHIHDLNCGYVEAVAEVPCDNECIDMDGDGVIDHVEDCAYTPAVEGLPCNHVHDENCGGLTENQSEETQPKQTQSEETEQELSNELLTLKARIDALPTGEEYRAMTSDEQDAVYEEAADIVDACLTLTEEELAAIGHDRLEALFMVMNEDIQLYDTSNPVTILNSGYPYGQGMTSSSITLVIEADGTAASYQWQTSDSKDGTFEDISGADQSTYMFTPVTGKWYRCMVNGTASEAVMAVKPGEDGRTWTKPYNSWYLSNGTMAYMAKRNIFDAVGLYTKNNTDYMLCTSYGRYWEMYSSSSSTPSSGTSGFPALDALRVSFSESDDYALIFEADLAEGQQAFSFGCDTQLGDRNTSGSYSDYAALKATVKNGALQQVAMIGAGTVAGAADTDPAFVIAPVDPASRFWIGMFNYRKTYAYNTSGGNAYETIDGQNVVTLLEGIDSGMTMSWMNIASGGSVRFQFSVGDVAHTGAVGGKVDYEKDVLTGLEAGTTYVITAGESTYTITANASGEIPLSGTDNVGNAYDFAGKSLNIAKQGSEDTPAEVEVVGRPDTPENPSDLEEEESGTSTPTVDESVEIVELTPNSATISPKEGQQYAYSTDGTNWTILTNTESNGTYVINGLTEGATIYIRTRIPATSSTPASQWSEPTQIKLKTTIAASANSWSGSYDGNAHQITVNVTSPVENATIKYSSTANGNYDEENPSFKDVGTYTVYYRVMAEGYYPTSGSATVTINKKEITVDNIKVDKNNVVKEVTFSGLIGNDNLTMDTDFSISNLNVSDDVSSPTASADFTLKNTKMAQNYYLSNANISGIHVIKHIHEWEYVICPGKTNTVYAYCKQDENASDCKVYGEQNAVTLTLLASDATCSSGVYSGASVIDNITPVNGEAVGNIEYYKDSTKLASAPTDVGTYTAKVSVGDKTVSQSFKIKHTIVTENKVEATCTKEGLTEGSYCSVCNTVFKSQEKIPALGHTYGEWEIVTPAGCVDKGSKKRVCSTCGNEETEDINPNGHTVVTDTAVLPTCTTTGLTAGSHCSVCGEIITAQTTVAALGHDWSNDWVITKLATATTEGKKECTCKREGCNQKKYEVIPVIGTPADPNEGKLDKDAEVAPEAPIEEATLDNTKTELLSAPAIFTAEEKQAIENGANARVWMEVSKTDESSIPSADKTKISDAATSIMGENPAITYFDADLFKQVGAGAATQLHEPGIDIEVTIKVPETLRNADSSFEREYKIIRLHTDVVTGASLVDILSGTYDKITGEFKFKTDKFSTYAIAYTDKKLVTGVTLTPETATLTQAGQSVQLTATVAPADATDKSVTWTSSNTNVATVDANGKVTAVANGTAVITVTTTDGNKTAQSTITVAIATTQTPSDNTTPSSSASTKKAVSNRIRLNGGMKFSQTGKQLNLAWGKVSGADGYDVYVQYCGKLFNAKSVTTIKNAKTNKLVIKKINGKSIDPKKVYKAYVVAYKMSNGKKVTLAKSITVHVVGSKHATETNVKSIKLSKSSYTLSKGKTAQIKAKSVLVDSKKKRISDNHGKEFRYTTSNTKVATVTKDGKIKAVGTGTCTIYVYAVNGYAKKITVTVK
ncbi:MAG: Ig-like domain-containing protein [Lachnobacterium sp.]|nr:Ig-like domain-containing protein [Lachnobacterium sp.]